MLFDVDDFKTCFDVVCRACRGRHNVCPSLHSQMLSASQNLSAWDELQKRSLVKATETMASNLSRNCQQTSGVAETASSFLSVYESILSCLSNYVKTSFCSRALHGITLHLSQNACSLAQKIPAQSFWSFRRVCFTSPKPTLRKQVLGLSHKSKLYTKTIASSKNKESS